MVATTQLVLNALVVERVYRRTPVFVAHAGTAKPIAAQPPSSQNACYSLAVAFRGALPAGCQEAGGLLFPKAFAEPGNDGVVSPAQQQPRTAAVFGHVSWLL